MRISQETLKTAKRLRSNLDLATNFTNEFTLEGVFTLLMKYVDKNEITTQELLNGKPAAVVGDDDEDAGLIREAIQDIARMAHTDEATVRNYLLEYALNQLMDLQQIAKDINNAA